MAVSLVHGVFGNLDVFYKAVNKSNRKGVTAAIQEFGDAKLVDHEGHKTGDFHIAIRTKVNGKPRVVNAAAGDVVFYTLSDGRRTVRWQVLSKEQFKKRFPTAKFS